MNILKNRHSFSAAKIILFLLLIGVIINRLFIEKDFTEQWLFFLVNLDNSHLAYLGTGLLLMPLNWLLETVKWALLIRSNSSFFLLFKSVIAGVTLGFVTPARSGEFLGRTFFLHDARKGEVLFLTFVGGIAHTAVTLIVGSLLLHFTDYSPVLLGVTTGMGVVFVLCFFRYDLFLRLIYFLPEKFSQKILIYEEVEIGFSNQLKILSVTLIRYLVYLAQYVLVGKFFIPSADFFQLAVYSGIFLMAQSFSPFLPLFDVGFRGGVALYVFSALTPNSFAILSIVTWIWGINLLLPALLGYMFFLNRRILAYAA